MDKEREKKNKFRVALVEAASPLSKQPGTPFRLAALGIKDYEYCYERKDTGKVKEDIYKPSPVPILPWAVVPQCQLSASETNFVAEIDTWVYAEISHGTNVVKEVRTDNPNVLIRLNGDGIEFKASKAGTNSFVAIFTYENGLECKLSMGISVDDLDPPIVPSKNKYTFAMCNTTSDPGDVYSASLDGVQFADRIDIEKGGHTNTELKLTPGKHSITVTLDKAIKPVWKYYFNGYDGQFYFTVVTGYDQEEIDLDKQVFKRSGSKSVTINFEIGADGGDANG